MDTNSMKHVKSLLPTGQRGSVLIISLIFLMLLTLIGITAMQTSTLQERMAGNTRGVNTALQAAEAALREGELYLQQANVGPFDGSINGLYQEAAVGTVRLWENPATVWAPRKGLVATVSDVAHVDANQPELIIEELRPYPTPGGSLASDEPSDEGAYYRVTTRGYAANRATMVMLQTTFKR